MFLDTLKASDDPMRREIGSGIADATMTWRTVATSFAYAEFVEQSLAQAREFDGSTLTEELTRERQKTADEERRGRARAEAADADDVFRGVLKRRKR